MPWIEFTDESGRAWQVNQDGLYAISRGSVRAKSAKDSTREFVSGEGWFDGPRMVELRTDWGKVNRVCTVTAQQRYDEMAREIMLHPENSARNLAAMVAETRSNQNYIRDQQQRTTDGNMAAVTRHVTNWEHAVTATRFVRDTSWTVLILLSAIPTGGTSAMAGTATTASFGLTVGSVGRGQAVYQDTGNVGAAVINGAGSFITGAIGLPPGGGMVYTSGQQALMLGIQSVSAGGFAGLQSHAEGNSAETAIRQAISSAGFNAAGGAMSGTSAFEGASLPVQLGIQLGMEIAGNAVNSAIANSSSSSDSNAPLSRPRATGRVTHVGIPVQESADITFIRNNILRPKP
ncbi:hypothetical protein N9L47_09870 [Rhodobacteraceae bacterium]|nr:hypothetical protein [Paracoccaceae bacterium]